MKCDLVGENERCASINKNTFNATPKTTLKISDYKSSDVKEGVKHVISKKEECLIKKEPKFKNTKASILSKEISRNSTNEILANNYSHNNIYSQTVDIKNRSSSLSNQMMAALGQPSAAPPSCGAAQTTVDPR